MGILFDRTTGYWTFKTKVDGKDKRIKLRRIEDGEDRRPIPDDVLVAAAAAAHRGGEAKAVQTLNSPVATLPPATEATPLAPWFDRYLSRYQRDRSPQSLKRMVHLVGPHGLFRRFAKLQGIKALNDITVEVIEDFVEWRYLQRDKRLGKAVGRSTVVSELRSLSGVFSAAVKVDRIAKNPVPVVVADHSKGLPRESEPKYLAPDQVRVFLSGLAKLEQEGDIPAEYADLARIMLYSGLRLSAAVHLRWSWIEPDWTIKVPASTDQVPTKTKVGYRAMIIGDGREVIERIKAKSVDKTGKVFPTINRKDSVQHQLSKLGITPHQLRHSFAVACVDMDVPLIVIQNLMGHADLKTTAIYAKLRPDKKLSVVNGIRFSFDKPD